MTGHGDPLDGPTRANPGPGLAGSSRVVVRSNPIRQFGLVRSKVPIFPAGHAVAWTLNLGRRALVWGWVR